MGIAVAFSDIKTSLADLDKSQLKEVMLLSKSLLGTQNIPTPIPDSPDSFESVIINELEFCLGAPSSKSVPIKTAQLIHKQLRELKLTEGMQLPQKIQLFRLVLIAIKECIKEEQAPLLWRTVQEAGYHLGDVLERQYPHYRLTGILGWLKFPGLTQ